ncbi:MAG: hypothetical protein Q8P17_01735 [bacterium]|nr:hypothetical protein [bacterium]
MTKLWFAYDLDKDVENFIKGAHSQNNSKPTKLQQTYIDKHGTVYAEDTIRTFLQDYIQTSGFDASATVQRVEREWRKIETVFFERVEKMFGIVYPVPEIGVYISTNSRCAYNIEKGYFFVSSVRSSSSMLLLSSNMILMHELLHFYTWQAFYSRLKQFGVDDSRYNDVKESLTELLNIEFADLMPEAHDEGYPQHAEMRQVVRKSWLATKDIRRTVLDALSIPNAVLE